MPVMEIAYIVGSIGMQLVNNLANSKQKKEQQERMREYKKAVLEQDMQRAREIQRESAECAKQLEAEAHRIRLEEIESEKDQFLAKWAKQLNIQYWPINVLPFVMMGESFGSMFGGGARTVAVHCIFTPSNYAKFNQLFYDDIDQGLEERINTNWSINSDHPVIYYGGCWKERGPYGIPKDIDLPDIDRLEQEIGKLPTLVITPYFDPCLHFRIRHWGMGERTFSKLIPPTDLFSYSYVKDQFPDPKKVDEEAFKKFCDTTVEEIVPFLESLIGFVADRYFWSFYDVPPVLLDIVKNSNLLEAQMKDQYIDFYKEEYNKGYKEALNEISKGSRKHKKIYGYYSQITPFYDEGEADSNLVKLLDSYDGVILREDIPVVEECISGIGNNDVRKKYEKQIEEVRNRFDIVQATYNFYEVCAILKSELRDEQYAIIKVVSKNTIKAVICSDGSVHTLYAFIMHKECNDVGKTFKILKEEQQAIYHIKPNEIIECFSLNDVMVSRLNAIMDDKFMLYFKMGILGKTMYQCRRELFERRTVDDLTYEKIIEWVKSKSQRGDTLHIMRFAYEDTLYVMAHLAPNEVVDLRDISFDRSVICKTYHIDTSIEEKMENELVYIQKIIK